jgi:hypothetical protein
MILQNFGYMKIYVLFLAVVLTTLSAATLSADVIWDQGPPDNLAFGVSDYDPLPSKDAQIGQYGDQFILTTNESITQIDWWGIYYIGNTPQPVDNFTIRFFTFGNDNPGEPDYITPFMQYNVGNAVNRTDTGIDPYGTHDLYSYSATIPALALGPGEYLVSIPQ